MAPAGDGLAAPARIQFSTRMGRVVLTATSSATRLVPAVPDGTDLLTPAPRPARPAGQRGAG